jgi:hypothetical protein
MTDTIDMTTGEITREWPTEPSVLRFSTDRTNIIGALVRAFAGMPEIVKSQVADTGRYKYAYADLGTALSEIRPVLAKQSLAVLQPVTNGAKGTVLVETLLLHESGEWASVTLEMTGVTDPHSMGSAITYGRRYSLLAVLGVATEDDDGKKAQDGKKAEHEAEESARREATNLFDRMKALGERGAGFKALVTERCPADHPPLTINGMKNDGTWRATVAGLLEEFETAPVDPAERAEAPVPEPVVEMPEGVVAGGALQMPATVRERIEALPAGEKAALRKWALDTHGIKNMLMPKADEVDVLVQWLDEYDIVTAEDEARVDPYAEVAEGEVDDRQA